MNHNSHRTNSFFRLLTIVWKTKPTYFLFLMMNFVCSGLFTNTLIQLPRYVLDMLQTQTVDQTQLLMRFTIIIVCGFGMSLSKVFYTSVGYIIRYDLLHAIHAKHIHVPLEHFEDPKNMDNRWSVSRSVTSIQGVQSFYLNLGSLSGNLAIILVSCITVFPVNPLIPALILGWFLIYSILMMRTDKKVEKIWADSGRSYRGLEYWNDSAKDVAYAKEFRVFRLKQWYIQKRDIYKQKQTEQFEKIHALSSKLFYYDNLYQFLRDVIIYTTLITLFYNQSITLAEFSTFGVLIAQLNAALNVGTQNVSQIIENYTSIGKSFDYLDVESESEIGEPFVAPEDWVIEFKDVTFKYPNTEKTIYENLNFTLRKGQKIAIIGLNGVGKTTLIKLLMRLYQPTSGHITLNGKNIHDYKLKEYYTFFAPVFQEMQLLAYSIQENMSFDKPGEEARMRDTFQKVGLENKLKDIPLTHPLTKYIDEKGMNLSGGETQKFFMARAVYSQREILILDEPTSALDAVSESEFYERIHREYTNNTILFISHRLASAQFCDEIILIEDQNIKEQGTHDMLMRKQGRYYELYQIQSKYYQEDRHEG